MYQLSIYKTATLLSMLHVSTTRKSLPAYPNAKEEASCFEGSLQDASHWQKSIWADKAQPISIALC
ncbi:MAG: hypothetical protein WBI34_12450 [Tenuifilaceae bacterium]|nr:hypothetical protein [Bacteroidales bacterium]MDI9516416.1 hypothetical protein [Bacteroidota bacterium]NLH55248.1 hypothetical protein [Rikenellaceae bacterium]HNV82100.1 hypothetical protein [Tenuifilaceae bacterium]MZP81221.1 hypothetical protein [Bacteroidales bacterium]